MYTYLLTPCSRVLLKKLTGSQEIHFILWNLKVRYHIYKCPLPAPVLRHINPLHSPPSTSCRSILILSPHLCQGLPSDLLPSGFPTNTLYAFLPSPIHAIITAPLILLDLITWIILSEEDRSLSSSLCSFRHFSVTLSLLGPNSILSTPLSNTLRLRSSVNMSDQVSHPYRTAGKIIVLCILICTCVDSKLKTKDSAPNDSKHSLTSICS